MPLFALEVQRAGMPGQPGAQTRVRSGGAFTTTADYISRVTNCRRVD
jgi:hypothetical protein